jgi:hypothetical protein
MKRHRGLGALSLVAVVLAWACSKSAGNGPGGPSGQDAGDDMASLDSPAENPPPPPDSSKSSCHLFDGTDPVALCLQNLVLSNQLSGAYAAGKGVVPSWDAMTGAVGSGHSWRDDVGFAASIGAYHCSSAVYGDTTLAPKLDAVMPDLGHTIVTELAAIPAGYDGEDYFRLRSASTGLDYASDTADAATVAQLADAFGRNLQASFATTVTWTAAGSTGDGGDDGGDGGGGTTMTSTLLGTPDGTGHVAYSPAQVVMAAAALVDMAVVHNGEPDAGTDPTIWVTTALSAVDYVWARGRDTKTGLFFQQLVTSSDPGHDALGQGSPTPDALLTDVQAEAVLGLARLQDGLNVLLADDAGLPENEASVLTSSQYSDEATALVQSLVDANLFDGTMSPPTKGAPPGAFLEALIPSTGAIDTNKTTLGNAWLLGGMHRVALGTPSHLSDILLGQLDAALIQQTPANSSLYTAVVDTVSGNAIQTDYLRAVSKSFHYATAFSPDGGTGGQEQGADSYRSDATAAVIESLTQLWRGRQQATPCSP